MQKNFMSTIDKKLLSLVETDLEKHKDIFYKQQAARFFKEKISLIGVRAAQARKISGFYFQQVKYFSKEALFQCTDELLQREDQEYKIIAFDWLHRIRKSFEKDDIHFFEHCLTNYVTNWASCDDLCTRVLGYFLYTYPEYIFRLHIWTQSQNRWMRRAAAVSLIYGLRKKRYLTDALSIADTLLHDKDDLVQKGYGWMLKVASKQYAQDICMYIEKHKHTMPRTALRYAIEKLPFDQRKTLMKK